MSESLETTQQNHAVASMSDSNSNSVTGLLNVTNLEIYGSSSPVLSTATTQDGGDDDSTTTKSEGDETTIIKELAEELEDEAAPVEFVDKNGRICNEYTQFTDFEYFAEYLQFCENGPRFTIRMAVHDRHGNFVRWAHVTQSKKLLKDFSAYFSGLDRTRMIESAKGYVDLDDIDHLNFLNLMTVIRNGAPCLGVNLGPKNRTMSILLEVYILADRFIMPLVKVWVTTAMAEYMNGHRHWAGAYQHDVLDHAIPGAAADHQEILLDFNDVWTRVDLLPEDNRPVQKDAILELLFGCCPRMLLCDTLERMHPDLVRCMCIALLRG